MSRIGKRSVREDDELAGSLAKRLQLLDNASVADNLEVGSIAGLERDISRTRKISSKSSMNQEGKSEQRVIAFPSPGSDKLGRRARSDSTVDWLNMESTRRRVCFGDQDVVKTSLIVPQHIPGTPSPLHGCQFGLQSPSVLRFGKETDHRFSTGDSREFSSKECLAVIPMPSPLSFSLAGTSAPADQVRSQQGPHRSEPGTRLRFAQRVSHPEFFLLDETDPSFAQGLDL